MHQQAVSDELLAMRTIAVKAHENLADALAELSKLKASRSWKLTAPYRWLGAKLKSASPMPKRFIPYESKDLSSRYYQDLHDHNDGYQAITGFSRKKSGCWSADQAPL
ncbi:hypothetical protein ACERNI_17845 [Camelimonas sp. ID_303_24]